MSATANLIFQYVVVGVVIALAAVYMLVKLLRKPKNGRARGGCCGCALKDACKKPEKDSSCG